MLGLCLLWMEECICWCAIGVGNISVWNSRQNEAWVPLDCVHGLRWGAGPQRFRLAGSHSGGHRSGALEGGGTGSHCSMFTSSFPGGLQAWLSGLLKRGSLGRALGDLESS